MRRGVRDLAQANFRASPSFRLGPPPDFGEATQLHGPGLPSRSAEIGGLLVASSGAGGRSVAVCANTARLVRELATPGGLPGWVPDGESVTRNALAAGLVLDGILEIETRDGFASGPAAFASVFETSVAAPACTPTSALSIAALRYATMLDLGDEFATALRLYRYNTTPISPRARGGRVLSSSLIDAHLHGARSGGVWERLPPSPDSEGWHTWVHDGGIDRPAPRWKLYLSPTTAAFGGMIPAAIEVIAASGARAFKLGRGARGLARPDKMVIYFESSETMFAAAPMLVERLGRTPPQGVPFTAAVDANGLLSWGVDPADDAQRLGADGRESWRWWIVCRLAAALHASRGAAQSVPPWEFALARLGLDGINPETFAPAMSHTFRGH